jgi:hypothetical protein
VGPTVSGCDDSLSDSWTDHRRSRQYCKTKEFIYGIKALQEIRLLKNQNTRDDDFLEMGASLLTHPLSD